MNQADLDAAWDSWSGTETVSLTPRSAGVDGSAVTGITAKKFASATMEEANEASSVDIERRFIRLRTSTLASNVPAPGDLITDADSVKWRIQKADKISYGASYRCHCIRELV